LGELTKASLAAASAVDRGDARGFIEAARATERGLSALGRDADAPIVPLSARGVIAVAESEESAFLPSGAGGGDVFVRIGTELASSRFVDAARELRFEKLDLAIDVVGVRILGKVGESSS
jgi:hypothetical protein